MKHANISIFVPHIGCPHLCSFCNQRTISGAQKAPTGGEVAEICRKSLGEVKSPENTEVAFFGGSFTAVPRDYMVELLEAAADFVGEGKFSGIRISTRPDCITPEILATLRKYNVTAIELGAQSMSDSVLEANGRGHTAADVFRSSELIKEGGFELGLQMMEGLYKSTIDDERATYRAISEIKPDTVRIYPTVILKNTKLGELYEEGIYRTFDFETVVNLSAEFMAGFEKSGIRVIKCGLHASEFVERDMVGGFYHPAFRELCENMIYRRIIENLVAGGAGNYTIAVNSSCISKAVGQKRGNISYFAQKGVNIRITGDEKIPKYEAEVKECI